MESINQVLMLLIRNILLSLAVFAIFFYLGQSLAYLGLGCLVSGLLAFKNLPNVAKIINPVFYIPVCALNFACWPMAVAAEIASAYSKGDK